MNRLTAVPQLPQSTSTAIARVQRPVLRKTRLDSPHCLMSPVHYEPAYAYPLLIWLHSAGTSEREIHQIMPLISERNYVALGIRGPVSRGAGHLWPQTAESIAAAEQRLLESIATARDQFNVHPQRIYIAGFEAAGTMALRLALRNTDRFAGAISLNGPFPEGHAPLARLGEIRKLRLLIAHCRDSVRYSTERLCRELSLFHTASLSVHLRQYPCRDSELTTQMLHDLDAWLMEQVTGVPATTDDEPATAETDWN